MSLYDGLKDALSIASKIKNKDLIQNLIDVQQQALDMQNENFELKSRVKELEDTKDLENRIIRQPCAFVMLSGDSSNTCFCSRCWDVNRKLVQVRIIHNNFGQFECPECNNVDYYDVGKANEYREMVDKALGKI